MAMVPRALLTPLSASLTMAAWVSLRCSSAVKPPPWIMKSAIVGVEHVLIAPNRTPRLRNDPQSTRPPKARDSLQPRVSRNETRKSPSQKQYQLERFQKSLDRTDLLICDELGYLSFSRTGAELLFQVFADRYERSSLLVTSNLPFSEWQQVFQGDRMTAALLDRLTHHCEIFEMNGESYRFRESMKEKKRNDRRS